MIPGARQALLTGLVDYAGLFPPASLDLAEALDRYDRHLRCPERALLGRFVLPAPRLAELAPWLDDPWSPERPLQLSLLAVADQLDDVARYLADTAAVRVGALEARPPADAEPATWLAALIAAAERAGLTDPAVYVELNSGTDADQLAALGASQRTHPLGRLGAKLRCGGVTVDLVPPVDRVAAVIAAACDLDVPLKFTAGLHHPVRGMGHTEGEPMHGFLNVYGAALLAGALGLAAADLEPVLAETDPAAFRLDADGFAWRDHAVEAAQVARLRRDRLGGYGSCSFDEPVADLRSLSLLT